MHAGYLYPEGRLKLRRKNFQHSLLRLWLGPRNLFFSNTRAPAWTHRFFCRAFVICRLKRYSPPSPGASRDGP